MRAAIFPSLVLIVVITTGCSTHRNAPYANDPVYLHYKPTLNDSATIIAEKQWRHLPAKPPKPPVAAEKPADNPLASQPATSPEISAAKPELTGSLLAPPPGSQPGPTAPVADAVVSSLPERPVEPRVAPAANSAPAPTEVVGGASAELPSPELLPLPNQNNEPAATPNTVQVAKAEEIAAPSSLPPDVPAAAGRRSVAGNFGHDKDYHWLQGTLERHYRGYYCIRYCDPSVEDANGGKVRLIESACLEQFQEGDVIGVEGELIPDSTDSFHTNPRYHIKDVWLVRKK
jgi:hypothetical protein